MPHTTDFGKNNTENGWIYRQLENKMIELDKQIQTVKNLLDTANTQFSDYTKLINEVSSKASTQYVKTHIDDSVCHITPQEIEKWNSHIDDSVRHITPQERDKWNRYAEIIEMIANEFEIREELLDVNKNKIYDVKNKIIYVRPSNK